MGINAANVYMTLHSEGGAALELTVRFHFGTQGVDHTITYDTTTDQELVHATTDVQGWESALALHLPTLVAQTWWTTTWAGHFLAMYHARLRR